MRVGQIRTNIEGYSDDVEIFVAWYERSEANEHIENNLCDGYKETDDLTQEEWFWVVKKMNNDDGIWQQLNEAFIYYVEQAVDNREEKGEANDNSE
jgi:hypothetical protein